MGDWFVQKWPIQGEGLFLGWRRSTLRGGLVNYWSVLSLPSQRHFLSVKALKAKSRSISSIYVCWRSYTWPLVAIEWLEFIYTIRIWKISLALGFPNSRMEPSRQSFCVVQTMYRFLPFFLTKFIKREEYSWIFLIYEINQIP